MAQVALTPPGPRRARALLRQSQLCFDDVLAGLHLCAQALDQPGLTADLRAEIHLRRAEIESAALTRTDEAIASFEAAANAGPSAALRAVAIAGAAYYRFRAGGPLDEEAFANAIALADAAGGDGVYALPRALRAFAVATLDLDRARPLFEIELRRAEERRDDVAVTAHRFHLAALEVSAGRLAAARMHLARADPGARAAGVFERHLTLQAAIQAAVGDVEGARAAAARAAAAATEAGDALALALARGTIATLELSLGDPAAAWQALSQTAESGAAEANPVLVRLLPDAAEALAELGRLDEAESIARRLEDARPVLGRSRGAALRARAVVARCAPVDSARAPGAGADRNASDSGRRVDAFRGAGRAAGRVGEDEPRDRAGAVREPEDGRSNAFARLPEARDPFEVRACRAPNVAVTACCRRPTAPWCVRLALSYSSRRPNHGPVSLDASNAP
jgi:hypothetical protein